MYTDFIPNHNGFGNRLDSNFVALGGYPGFALTLPNDINGDFHDPTISYGLLGRLGVRWALFPSVIIDGSIGYQLEVARSRVTEGIDDVVHWDIRLGAEVFVPWGALACRATGAFCD